MKKIILSTISLLVGNICFSQQDVSIAYDPSSNLYLGSCADYNAIFDSKQDCISPSEKEWIDGGAVKTEVSTLFITSHKDVSNNFKLSYHSDIKASLSFGGGGSVNYDFTMNHYFKNISNSLYFVVKAETSHGRLKLKDVTLKNEFQKLLDESKFSEFITKCGTHYVRFETRRSSVYAIISISNIESEIKNHIISKYSASANIQADGFGSVNANTKLDIDNLFNEISRHGKVQISYLAHGSEGIKSFSPIISNSSSYKISDILENLSKTLNDFNKNKSAPVEYRLASFEPFGLSEYHLESGKLIFLQRTQANLNMLFDGFNQIQEIKDSRYDDYLLYYKAYEDQISALIKESIQKLRDCYYDSNYNINTIPDDKELLDKIIWPSQIFADIEIEYNPYYSEAITFEGDRKQVLTSLSVTVVGSLRHSDYYKLMTPLRMTPKLELLPTNGLVVNENNPSLGTPVILDFSIKTQPFMLRIESFNLDILPLENGLILIDQELINKHNELIKNLNERDYIVNVETTDGNYFNQLVDFSFNESDVVMVR